MKAGVPGFRPLRVRQGTRTGVGKNIFKAVYNFKKNLLNR